MQERSASAKRSRDARRYFERVRSSARSDRGARSDRQITTCMGELQRKGGCREAGSRKKNGQRRAGRVVQRAISRDQQTGRPDDGRPAPSCGWSCPGTSSRSRCLASQPGAARPHAQSSFELCCATGMSTGWWFAAVLIELRGQKRDVSARRTTCGTSRPAALWTRRPRRCR